MAIGKKVGIELKILFNYTGFFFQIKNFTISNIIKKFSKNFTKIQYFKMKFSCQDAKLLIVYTYSRIYLLGLRN